MAHAKDTHHWGREAARERYATGGAIKENNPGDFSWTKWDKEHPSGKLAKPMGFTGDAYVEPSKNEAIKGED